MQQAPTTSPRSTGGLTVIASFVAYLKGDSTDAVFFMAVAIFWKVRDADKPQETDNPLQAAGLFVQDGQLMTRE